MSIVDTLDIALEMAIRARQYPVRFHLGPEEMTALMLDLTSDITLAGDNRPIWQAIEQDYPDLMPIVDVGDGAERHEVTRAAIVKLRMLVRDCGLGSFRGVPVVDGVQGQIRLETRRLDEGE